MEVERTGAELGVPGVAVEVEPERDDSFFREFTRLESDILRFIELLKEGWALEDEEEEELAVVGALTVLVVVVELLETWW